MLQITITTSMQTRTYMLDLPITDDISLHYDQCDYCEVEPTRRESIFVNNRHEHRFCKPSHRVIFSQKRIGEALTARC